MAEHPIIFSGPMVRALLDGRKTQTRRVVKPQPATSSDGRACGPIRCPYGAPGDLLWVRETIRRGDLPNLITGEPTGTETAVFAAGSDPRTGDDWVCERNGFNVAPWWRGPSLPSIRMPRWASRLTLHVTGVRVERVQDISEDDAVAEGVADTRGAWDGVPGDRGGPRESFRNLWDSINAKRGFGWDANPWVWVVSFEPMSEVRHAA